MMLLEPQSGELRCYIDVIDSSIILIVCSGRRNFADGLQLSMGTEDSLEVGSPAISVQAMERTMNLLDSRMLYRGSLSSRAQAYTAAYSTPADRGRGHC